MKVLITGGYGFIGSHTAEKFHKEGHEVFIIDNLSSVSTYKINFKHKFYNIDIGDKKCEEIFKNNRFDVVVNLAAQLESENSANNVLDRAKVDILGLINMLDLSARYKVKKFIFASSSAVYGNSMQAHPSEDYPADPESPYGFNKHLGEQYCEKWRQFYNLETVCFRISKVYGPGMRLEGNGSIFASLADESSSGEDIYINVDRSGRGDFIFIFDVAEAIYRAAESYVTGVYNLSSNEEISVNDIVNIFEEVGIKRGITFREENRGETLGPCLDNSKLKKALDWIPIYDMVLGIRYTYNVYRSKSYKKENAEKVKKKLNNRLKLDKLHPYIENILIFILIYLIEKYVHKDIAQSFIDVKLIYIILISIVYGTKQTALAVVLTGFLFINEIISSGRDIVALFLVSDMLPNFAMYILFGFFISYNIDKKDRTIEFEERKYKDLDEKYEFLRELYDETYEVKCELQNQIINSEDSFGKIYGVIKDLDSLEPQYILTSAVEVLENLLKSDEISIYSVDKTYRYMRMVVRSSKSVYKYKKSVVLDSFMDIKEILLKGEVYINKDLRPGVPVMMAPIIDGTKLIGVILLNDIAFERLTLYYQNLFKVVCSLISSSIIKAYAYEDAISEERYIKNTFFLKSEFFNSIMEIKKKSWKENKADFSLLRISDANINHGIISSVLQQCIRSTDFAGIGKDGHTYVLLTNATISDADMVASRIRNFGVKCEVFSGEDMYG